MIVDGSSRESVFTGSIIKAKLGKLPLVPLYRTTIVGAPHFAFQDIDNGKSVFYLKNFQSEYGLVFNISDDSLSIAVITFGYPDDDFFLRSRRTDLGEVLGADLKDPENQTNVLKRFEKREVKFALQDLAPGDLLILYLNNNLEISIDLRKRGAPRITIWGSGDAWKWRTEICETDIGREIVRQKYIERGDWVA